MPIDPSIPLQASPGAPQGGMNFKLGNPLEMAHQFATIQNQVNQSRQFEQLYKARNALGPILQSSVEQDPNSPSYGMIDVGKAMATASTNPDAAWLAPDYIKGALANQQTQLENNQKQLALGLDRTKLMSGIFARLQPLGDNITQQDILDAASDVHATGAVPAQDVASWLKRAGTGGPRSAQFIRTAATENAILNQHFETAFGKVEQALTGNSIQYNRVNAITGQVDKLGGSIPVRMSPAEASAQREGPTVQGALTKITAGELAEQSGQAPVGTYMGGGAGENPLPLQPEAKPAAPLAGPIQTAIRPAAKELQEQGTKNTLEYMKDVNQQMLNWVPLQSVLDAQRKALAAVEAGKASEFQMHARESVQFLRQLGLPLPEKLVKWAEGGEELPSAQTFRAAAAIEAITMMKQAVEGTGRAMRPEVDIFIDRYGKMTNDPRTLENIYNFVTRTGEKYFNQQQDFQEFRKQVDTGKLPDADYVDFPAWAARQAMKRNEIDFTQRSGGAKGTQGSAAKEWVIKDGKLVPKTQ